MASKAVQRTVALMQRLDGKRRERESERDYFKRLQDTAIEIQRKDRARKRKAARAARKRNRHV